MYNSIRPGQPWLDTNGKRIQAHGGSVMYLDGVYYWYGENKENTTGKDDVWHNGVRCYSSIDLYNWEDRGIIIPPEDDINSSLHPTSQMDRPHIIYNRETEKYVCWLKIMGRDGSSQTETVLVADNLLGPYTKVKEGLKPLGMSAGDFDLTVAPDGKAYYYFERVHSETICADLTDDYTDVTGYYSTHFPHPYPPYVREATAHLYRKNKHYLITSGTTGYNPNPSEVAIGDSWHGPYTVLGNPHPGDESNTSYHSQISSVFKVAGKKDLYIACADRWLPDKMYQKYEEYGPVYAAIGERIEELNGLMLPKEEHAKRFLEIIMSETSKMEPDTAANTSIADYVWLPLRFVEPNDEFPMGMVFIDWKDEWRIEDYE